MKSGACDIIQEYRTLASFFMDKNELLFMSHLHIYMSIFMFCSIFSQRRREQVALTN